MAIVRRGRASSATAESRDGGITLKFRQPYLIELGPSDPDPISDAEVMVLPGVPVPGRTILQPRPGFVVPFAICQTIAPSPRTSRRLWDLVATFELSGSEDSNPVHSATDPTSLAPRIEPFTSDIELPLVRDFSDVPIVDPFGDLFETPVMAPIPLPGIRVTRYVDEFDENTLATWKHATNHEPWRGQPADTWCITEVTGREVEWDGLTFGQLQFDISANELELPIEDSEHPGSFETTRVGWMDARLLRSTDYLDESTPAVRRVNLVDGSPRSIYIDRFGKRSEEPRFVAFRNRRQRDFSAILPP